MMVRILLLLLLASPSLAEKKQSVPLRKKMQWAQTSKVETQLSFPRARLTVPEGWTTHAIEGGSDQQNYPDLEPADGAQAGTGMTKLAIMLGGPSEEQVEIGPSATPRPTDVTYANVTVYPKPPGAPPTKDKWMQRVQAWDRPIDATFPIADSATDKTSTQTWAGQPWVVRERDLKGGKAWYAITYKGKREVFVFARASTDHAEAMAHLLASIVIR
jgi:hypothetical protein